MNSFFQNIKNRFRNYEHPVDPGTFNSIANSLDQIKSLPTSAKSFLGSIKSILFIAGSVLSAVTIFSVFYFTNLTDEELTNPQLSLNDGETKLNKEIYLNDKKNNGDYNKPSEHIKSRQKNNQATTDNKLNSVGSNLSDYSNAIKNNDLTTENNSSNRSNGDFSNSVTQNNTQTFDEPVNIKNRLKNSSTDNKSNINTNSKPSIKTSNNDPKSKNNNHNKLNTRSLANPNSNIPASSKENNSSLVSLSNANIGSTVKESLNKDSKKDHSKKEKDKSKTASSSKKDSNKSLKNRNRIKSNKRNFKGESKDNTKKDSKSTFDTSIPNCNEMNQISSLPPISDVNSTSTSLLELQPGLNTKDDFGTAPLKNNKYFGRNKFALSFSTGKSKITTTLTSIDDPYVKYVKNANDKNYKNEINWHYSAQLHYFLTEHFEISTGAEFSKFSSDSYLDYHDWIHIHDTILIDTIIIINDSIYQEIYEVVTHRDSLINKNISAHNSAEYFTVPLNFSYSVNLRRFRVWTNAGLGLNFLLKGNEFLIYPWEEYDWILIDNKENLKPFFANLSLGFGAGYQLNENFEVFAHLRTNFYGRSRYTPNSFLLKNEKHIGGSLGVKYRF